jgi:alanine racemase
MHHQIESRVRLEIDLDELRNNFKKIANAVKPCGVIAVLKANAYGLGAKEIGNALKQSGAAGFGAAELNEALELAELGLPVQLLGNILPGEIAPAIAADIIMPINDYKTAAAISREAVKQNRPVRCDFLIDTGMGRLGILFSEAREVINQCVKLPNLDCRGIYSHFPVAYQPEGDYTRSQISDFKKLLVELSQDGIDFERVHIANSDAINNFSETCEAPFNLVRTGINLYGLFDDIGARRLGIKSIVSLKTRLAAVRTLPAGAYIGYGLTCKLVKPTRVGTIAAGYADGLPLMLSNRGYVVVRGALCPIIGRISMDYTTISLENVPDAECGDEVICLGGTPPAAVTIDNWALTKGTNPYDILCSFGSRTKRIYLNQ